MLVIGFKCLNENELFIMSNCSFEIDKTRYRLRKMYKKNERKQHDIPLSVERRLKVTKCYASCPWLGFSGLPRNQRIPSQRSTRVAAVSC